MKLPLQTPRRRKRSYFTCFQTWHSLWYTPKKFERACNFGAHVKLSCHHFGIFSCNLVAFVRDDVKNFTHFMIHRISHVCASIKVNGKRLTIVAGYHWPKWGVITVGHEGKRLSHPFSHLMVVRTQKQAFEDNVNYATYRSASHFPSSASETVVYDITHVLHFGIRRSSKRVLLLCNCKVLIIKNPEPK